MDPNIGWLIRRLIHLGVPFKDLIVGPDCAPNIAIELDEPGIVVDGELIRPSSTFIRHDVFWAQQSRKDSNLSSVALNWFYAIRGWMLANEEIRCFNRFSNSCENNKIYNLILARQCGLEVCKTLIGTLSSSEVDHYKGTQTIVKPVAGGSLTIELQSALTHATKQTGYTREADYPRFIQKKLNRPEMRVFGVGDQAVAFSITSEDLDYRERHQAKIELTNPPGDLLCSLRKLAEVLGLTFYAADFMRDETDKLIFLEINTQPMFITFDKASGGKITDAIVAFLEPKLT